MPNVHVPIAQCRHAHCPQNAHHTSDLTQVWNNKITMLQLIACDCTCSDSDAAAPGATAAARAECAAERAARGCYDYAAIEAACEADPTKLNALCKVPIDTTQVAQCPNAQYPAQCPIPYLMLDAQCPMPMPNT
jgi:hypothetical protein